MVLTYSLPSLSRLLLKFTSFIYSYSCAPHSSFPRDMENSKWEGKRNMEEEDDEEDENVLEDTKRKRVSTHSGRKVSTGEGSRQPSCQVENCTADMVNAKPYHRRHKVCEFHAKAPAVLIDGLQQRFCQQCSRFHQLAEFDDAKKSCRTRLAGHNERRRKSAHDSPGEGSS